MLFLITFFVSLLCPCHFEVHLLLVFMKSKLLSFSFVICVTIQHIFAKSNVVELLFHVSLKVFPLLCRSLMYFGVIFWMWHKMRVQIHSFTCGYSVFLAHVLKRLTSPPLNALVPLLKIMWLYIWGFISRLSVLLQYSVCPCLCPFPIVLVTVAS